MKTNIKYKSLGAASIVGLSIAGILMLSIPVLILGVILEGPKWIFNSSFKDIPSEADQIPAYVLWGDVITGDEKIQVSEICRKQNEYADVSEVFYIDNDKIYIVYNPDITASRRWIIASVDRETEELESLCEFTNPKERYICRDNMDFSERNGYYYNSQIILHDHETVVVYDIETGESAQYDYDTYDFPTKTIFGDSIDRETVELNIEGTIRTFSLLEMAEKSPSIAQIYALGDSTTWSGTSRMAGFFLPNCIQVVGEEIYAIGGLLNYAGECHVVILEYDRQSDTWEYIFMDFISEGRSSRACYIVPSE